MYERYRNDGVGVNLDPQKEQALVDTFNAAQTHLSKWSQIKTLLEHSIQTQKEIAACGEVARASFVNLTQRKKVTHVECVAVTKMHLGHTFNVLNRDQSLALSTRTKQLQKSNRTFTIVS